jgi:hypothetical protein
MVAAHKQDEQQNALDTTSDTTLTPPGTQYILPLPEAFALVIRSSPTRERMRVGRKRNTTPIPTRDGIGQPVFDCRSSSARLRCAKLPA